MQRYIYYDYEYDKILSIWDLEFVDHKKQRWFRFIQSQLNETPQNFLCEHNGILIMNMILRGF